MTPLTLFLSTLTLSVMVHAAPLSSSQLQNPAITSTFISNAAASTPTNLAPALTPKATTLIPSTSTSTISASPSATSQSQDTLQIFAPQIQMDPWQLSSCSQLLQPKAASQPVVAAPRIGRGGANDMRGECCAMLNLVGSAAERQLKLALEKGALGNSLTAGTNSDKCGAVAKVMGACGKKVQQACDI